MASAGVEHVPKIKKSNFNRQTGDTDTVRNNCTIGYRFTHTGAVGAAGQQENHHILPISSLDDPSIPQDKLDYWHGCMALTTWDINNSGNLIGLPLKTVYQAYDVSRLADSKLLGKISPWDISAATQGGRGVEFGTLPDLPCHENEHNSKGGYCDKVITYLKRNIWNPLAKAKKACKADGVAFAQELNNASNKWRTFLIDRGAGAHTPGAGAGKGAAHCWIHRWDHNGYARYWYWPFSMNPGTPRKMKRPPKYQDRTGTEKEWLSSFFTAL